MQTRAERLDESLATDEQRRFEKNQVDTVATSTQPRGHVGAARPQTHYARLSERAAVLSVFRICGASELSGYQAKETQFLYFLPVNHTASVYDTLPNDEVDQLKAAYKHSGRDPSLLTRTKITRLYNATKCRSGCFVAGSPANLRIPTAPRTLEIMMSHQEWARARFVVMAREPVSRDISCASVQPSGPTVTIAWT